MGYVQYPSDETWIDAGVSGQVLGGNEAQYVAAKRQDEYASICEGTYTFTATLPVFTTTVTIKSSQAITHNVTNFNTYSSTSLTVSSLSPPVSSDASSSTTATDPSDYSAVSPGSVPSSSMASTSPANGTVAVVTVFVTPSTCVASQSRRTSTMTTYTTVFVKA
ncbi:hypothetical protein KC332_g575 [Hortaea werneckii]|uniref:Uncharacterized protein n=1 Tax=Hortaea werneckii TaxID=91943 RepID=A0A3M7IM51_HORWE|nr:hypothetical protein KC342_g1649 [Hortaea werneckii]KAI6843388.1 hypothetical protein KC358_g3869 [Hortaea werneckii]KAI6852773.1 hypothetical protein KC350_g567 [Hortaea werneckii]KAI6943457.1 hypothetical protein KC341_g1501 [Hortaea werneckii]KAI6946617.1 hypothetical protein KC348_g3043 [Hortaea werneckii]